MGGRKRIARQRAIEEAVEAILKYAGPYSSATARTAAEMVLRPMMLAGLHLKDVPTRTEAGIPIATHEGLEQLCRLVVDEERVPVPADVQHFALGLLAERSRNNTAINLMRDAGKLSKLGIRDIVPFENLAVTVRRALSRRAQV